MQVCLTSCRSDEFFFANRYFVSDTYRTEEEFRQMFDHNLYDKMRVKYNCKSAFPEVFGKVNKNVRD